MRPRLERALGGDERLGENLPAEDAAVRHPLARSDEDVFLGARPGVGEVEGGQQAGKRVVHRVSRLRHRESEGRG